MAHYAKYCPRCNSHPARTFEQHLVECRGVTDHPALRKQVERTPLEVKKGEQRELEFGRTTEQ